MSRVTARKVIPKEPYYKNGKKKPVKWEWRFEGAKVNGKRKQMSKGGFATRKEAETAGAIAYAEYQAAGQVFRPTELSVADYMDEWFEKYCKMNVKYNSQIIYKNAIKNYIKPRLGKYKLNSLSPAVLQEFVNDLSAEGHAKKNIEQLKTTLSAALKYAVYPMQYIKDNPMSFVKLPKKSREGKQKVIISREQYEALLNRFPFGNRHHLPIMIAYHCGLRTGEVCGLTWNDIDFDKRTLTVNKQSIRMKFDDGVGFMIGEPKTKSSNRTLIIDSILLEALKKEKAYQEQCEQRLKQNYHVHTLVDALDPHGNEVKRIATMTKQLAEGLDRFRLVCVNEHGAFTSNDTIKYIARVAKEQLEMPEFDFHSLRHTHATILVENNASAKNVQHRMGHNSIKTTLDTYVKNTNRMDENSAKIFDEMFNK